MTAHKINKPRQPEMKAFIIETRGYEGDPGFVAAQTRAKARIFAACQLAEARGTYQVGECLKMIYSVKRAKEHDSIIEQSNKKTRWIPV